MKKLKVKVGKSALSDMLKFKNIAKERAKVISSAKPNEIQADFPINDIASKLHPDKQSMVVSEIIDHPQANARTYILQKDDIYSAANFRAGQYLSVILDINGSIVTRPYSISSSPAWTKAGKYAITVRAVKDGFASEWIFENWKVGDIVTVSDPQGNFYYDDLRDPENIVALAGGSGITPFLSMAYAIRDGVENFKLTIIYGSKTSDSILFADELNGICEETSNVRVVHVLSDEETDRFESGFITAELIKKYAPHEMYSVFICGPEAMYKFTENEVKRLGLPEKNIRREMLGVTKRVRESDGYPTGEMIGAYRLTVKQGENVSVIDANADEPILVAIERSGINAPSRCRSGECGWCRSKLISGKVFCPAENEYRRWADKENNYIHPCCTFALSDVFIEIPGSFVK